MKKKKTDKKIISRSKKKEARDQFMVILEDIKSKFDFLAEGQTVIQNELREFKGEMYDFRDEMYGFRDEMYSFKGEMYSFRDEMYSFRGEMYSFKGEMYSFKSDTESNFKKVFEYLSGIEDELVEIKKEIKNLRENKVGKKDREYVFLAKKVLEIEKEVGRIKIALKLETI